MLLLKKVISIFLLKTVKIHIKKKKKQIIILYLQIKLVMIPIQRWKYDNYHKINYVE